MLDSHLVLVALHGWFTIGIGQDTNYNIHCSFGECNSLG